MVRVIAGKIINKLSERKQNYFELAEGSSYRGQNYIKCMTEIHGKSILLRVSTRFELSGVNCIYLMIVTYMLNVFNI